MDLLDNAVNKRAMEGSLPIEILHPASYEFVFPIDIAARAAEGLTILKDNTDLLYILVKAFYKKVEELDSLHNNNNYLQDINCIINAKCSENDLSVNGSLNFATQINPVVTKLDKVLWYGAYAYNLEKTLIPNKAEYDPSSMAFAWVYLLDRAQMLYAQYASKEYAAEGFDFSCISALYYQAFEDAYNDLVWRGYAQQLNKLEIDGQKYTDILNSCKNTKIDVQGAKVYLGEDWSQIRYYLKVTKKETLVEERCMYKSFGILMEKVDSHKPLAGFCEYFAELVGFSKKEEMFSNVSFMTQCKAFAEAIKKSADDRNNASHGGSYISISQCTSDKDTVLNNLETVRSTSIGLVQKLLYLLQ